MVSINLQLDCYRNFCLEDDSVSKWRFCSISKINRIVVHVFKFNISNNPTYHFNISLAKRESSELAKFFIPIYTFVY